MPLLISLGSGEDKQSRKGGKVGRFVGIGIKCAARPPCVCLTAVARITRIYKEPSAVMWAAAACWSLPANKEQKIVSTASVCLTAAVARACFSGYTQGSRKAYNLSLAKWICSKLGKSGKNFKDDLQGPSQRRLRMCSSRALLRLIC